MIKKVKEEELPDWLPEGWSMEIRPRIRGERFPELNGGTYPCYIAPITNLKCYSKPEVFRYLQGSSNRRTPPSSKTANGNTNKSTSNPSEVYYKVKKEELPDWLPEGWSMEIRPRIRGERFPKPNGGTYQCYIAPITNLKFYSKPEVFGYLQGSGDRYTTRSSNKTTNGNTNKSTIKPTELPAMNRSQKNLDEDSNLKLRTRGEVDKVPDCQVKIRYTKATIRRTIASAEQNRQHKRIRAGYFPGNDGNKSVFTSAETEVPCAVNGNTKEIDFPDAVSGNSTTDGGNNGSNNLIQSKPLMESEMDTTTHEGPVNKLSNSVGNRPGLKCMHSSEVHKKQERVKYVFKRSQGPVLLPVGYIPHSPGTLWSISNHGENVSKPLASPFHHVSTDPCIMSTRTMPADTISTQGNKAGNSGTSLFHDHLPSPWARATENAWKTVALKGAPRSGSSFFQALNSSKVQ